ncbi:MAG: thioesterase family protein [Alphaproteobacteria bacterium]|nr:MAG: thioesterase family protein [Alphaproteobacteria bacterium]
MQDTSFISLLAGLQPQEAGFSVDLPADWLQGRTAYGGLSAALAYAATTSMLPGLPPLRSAHFAFVGPAMGTLGIAPSVLRQGKSTTFVGVDLTGEAGLAVRALLCFGADRDSILDHQDLPAPPAAAPDACPDFFNSAGRPGFTRHFDGRLAGGARPLTPDAEPMMLVWLKHRDMVGDDVLTGLIALADALPPAAMVMFPAEWRPISTMTWTIDMLTDSPSSASGWWLVRNVAQTAAGGYSAQDMTIWDESGRPIAAMRQTVAIFA